MNTIEIGLASVVVLGIVAQWIAWRLRIPSIVLLLLFGFIAGPVTGLLDPDALFDDLLLPLVSLSVGIILFEGGLTLRVVELRRIQAVVRNLNSISVIATWIMTSIFAHYLLDLSWALSILLGAILVVTGPTVIGPLLRHVGNVGQAGSILKWEGILIDPVGATLAVLVFEAIIEGSLLTAPVQGLFGFLRTALVGGFVGFAAARILIVPLKRYWIPDFLQNSVTLMLVVGAFAFSNTLQPESGLLATTVMGIMLTNTYEIDAEHIMEFKENLVVLLISILFIVLSARLDMTIFDEVTVGMGLFLAALILIVRPLSVAVATRGSDLTWKERAFVGWMAPRGIVAAAVASIFALELEHAGYAEAGRLVPIVFVVIVVTVLVYGLTAVPVSRLLGLGKTRPNGILIAGAHDWGRELARVLQGLGRKVLLVDNNREHIHQARLEGLPTFYGSILSELTEERVELEGLGRLFALTGNDEINSLAAVNYSHLFGQENVYQLAPQHDSGQGDRLEVPERRQGQSLFSSWATSSYLTERFSRGATIKATRLSDQFTYDDLQAHYGGTAVPLLLVTPDGGLRIFTAGQGFTPESGQTLVSLVDPVDEKPDVRAQEQDDSLAGT